MSSTPRSFEHMSVSEFEARLPDLFATGNGRVSDDPNVRRFLDQNPTCAALVQDLEYIAEVAANLLEPAEEEPSDHVWSGIQNKLKIAATGEDPQ